jgi:hypothetical protein
LSRSAAATLTSHQRGKFDTRCIPVSPLNSA